MLRFKTGHNSDENKQYGSCKRLAALWLQSTEELFPALKNRKITNRVLGLDSPNKQLLMQSMELILLRLHDLLF